MKKIKMLFLSLMMAMGVAGAVTHMEAPKDVNADGGTLTLVSAASQLSNGSQVVLTTLSSGTLYAIKATDRNSNNYNALPKSIDSDDYSSYSDCLFTIEMSGSSYMLKSQLKNGTNDTYLSTYTAVSASFNRGRLYTVSELDSAGGTNPTREYSLVTNTVANAGTNLVFSADTGFTFATNGTNIYYNGTYYGTTAVYVYEEAGEESEVEQLITDVTNADTCNDYENAKDYMDRYNALSAADKATFDAVNITEGGESVNLKNKLDYMKSLYDRSNNNAQQDAFDHAKVISNNISDNTLYIIIVGVSLLSIVLYTFIMRRNAKKQ